MTALYAQSLLDGVTSERVQLHTIILSSIVCILSKISNYKWYTTINFIRNWTFNLFSPNVCSSQANLYSLMARPSFYERLWFDSTWLHCSSILSSWSVSKIDFSLNSQPNLSFKSNCLSNSSISCKEELLFVQQVPFFISKILKIIL